MEPRIYRIIHLMMIDLNRETSLNQLAGLLNLSVSRFCHLFKAEAGISPMRYLKAQRMKKAKELLETSFLNVKEVMSKVGAKDRSHFTKDFKKLYGQSPSQHRIEFLKAKQKENLTYQQ